MGLLDAIFAPSDSLKPVSPPVGRYLHMMRESKTTLVMKESLLSISGDGFNIVNAETNETLMTCSGKIFSFHDCKKIYGAEGTMLYNMADKKMSLGQAFVVEDAEVSDVLAIKKKWSLGSKLVADSYQDGKESQISLSGDFWGGSANIHDQSGNALAHISCDMINVNEVVADQQTYCVTVAPGVDLALIACMCIAFDETKNEADREEEDEQDKDD
ncbi:hypothetical protein CspeluHIS016_0211050 [Cutaneotrichosporon spelunceum]|uniref:DUF567-domain-containing protein n=1 Tax=Cutaneotrichosporon spelunceum TaxID=1672016 RepID=A0AAD3YBQ7_9TREE|nr:hypothetical protein CspeluHIS016_0211050 [Cutaneotrichosporon spelunceum]